jgi:hypothetical protein
MGREVYPEVTFGKPHHYPQKIKRLSFDGLFLFNTEWGEKFIPKFTFGKPHHYPQKIKRLSVDGLFLFNTEWGPEVTFGKPYHYPEVKGCQTTVFFRLN